MAHFYRFIWRGLAILVIKGFVTIINNIWTIEFKFCALVFWYSSGLIFFGATFLEILSHKFILTMQE